MDNPLYMDWMAGQMQGKDRRHSRKLLEDMRGRFANDVAAQGMDQKAVLYEVEWVEGASQPVAGALNWGVTRLNAGRVGDEFLMTHGHFHTDPSRGEFYAVAKGQGKLLLMDRERKTWAEEMSAGSLHAIDGRHAHRVVNTGDEPLIFWACWPADAGHDYASIAERGFGARVLLRDGCAVLVHEEER